MIPTSFSQLDPIGFFDILVRITSMFASFTAGVMLVIAVSKQRHLVKEVFPAIMACFSITAIQVGILLAIGFGNYPFFRLIVLAGNLGLDACLIYSVMSLVETNQAMQQEEDMKGASS